MEYDNEFKSSKFDSFYQFLRKDGLKARKSERLHKKKIYSNLINNHKITIENFEDYLEFEKKESVQNIIGLEISLNGINSLIQRVTFIDNNCFKLHTKEQNIKVEYKSFEHLKKNIIFPSKD